MTVIKFEETVKTFNSIDSFSKHIGYYLWLTTVDTIDGEKLSTIAQH